VLQLKLGQKQYISSFPYMIYGSSNNSFIQERMMYLKLLICQKYMEIEDSSIMEEF
jgi:hypothetical protein